MSIDPAMQRAFDNADKRAVRKQNKLAHQSARARDGRDLEHLANFLLGERRAPMATFFGRRGTVRGIRGVAGAARA